MKYFYVANHLTRDAGELDFHPSEGEERGYVVPDHPTKSAHRKWTTSDTTDHRFISLVEPVNPNQRTSTENYPVRIYGFVADYDCPTDEDALEKMEKILDGAPPPTWRSTTFSGFLRLIWEFEEPVAVPANAGKAFLTAMCARLRAKKLHPGLDDGSVEPARYYEIGTNWEALGPQLDVELARRVLFSSFTPEVTSDLAIPFDAVAEEVTKRFGHRLGDIPFEVGARTPLFWVDDDIDRIGAEVKEEGMIAYSDRAEVWNDWASILGQEWVAKYESKHLEAAIGDSYTDGKAFWIVEGDHVYDESRENFILRLRQRGLSPNRSRTQKLSEVEKAILYVNETRRVDGVGPFIFRDEEVVEVDGRKILNTNRVRCVAPAAGECTPEQFPWIHKFLSGLFEDVPVAEGATQLDLFLTWLQRLYVAIHEKRKLSGHCLILSGPTGRGKTLLSKRLIGGLCGGSEDASSYLTGQTQFNRNLTESPVWTVDDTSSASDWRQNRKMTDLIKRSVANPFVESRAMYRDPQEVEWHGRLVITLNEDAASLSIVPQQDSSNRDKVIGLRIDENAPNDFPPNDELEALIEAELPYFANWLLRFMAPDSLRDSSRYGPPAWFHPHLRDAARDNSPTQAVMEVLDLFAKLHRESHGEFWKGTAAELLGTMGNYTEIKARGGSFEHQRLVRDLQQAAENCRDNDRIRPVWCRNTGGGKVWTIDLSDEYDLHHDDDE